MIPLREAFPFVATGAVLLGGAGGMSAFLFGALAPAGGPAAAFAAVFLLLVVAVCAGPFLGRPAVAAPRAALLGGAGACACAAFAAAHGGPAGATALCAGFAGLLAYALAAVASACRAPVAGAALAVLGLLLLATFAYWDPLLDAAADRKASAALAYALNPAAAASSALGYDWIHAPRLYTSSRTAEAMFGIPLPGLFAYAWKTALVAAAGTALAPRRKAAAA